MKKQRERINFFRCNWLKFFGTVIVIFLTATFGCGGGGGNGGPAAGNDFEPPTTPANVNCTTVSESEIDLTWNASSDNVAVTSYHIYRNGIEIASAVADDQVITMQVIIIEDDSLDTEDLGGDNSFEFYGKDLAVGSEIVENAVSANTTSYRDTGLEANTQYCYAISASDAAGNESELSNEECAITEDIGCGEGLPLIISDLSFPSAVSDGTTENGSVAYQGAYEDITNPLMFLYIPIVGGYVISVVFSTPTVNNCIMDFIVSIPSGLSGTGPIYFKLVDYDDGEDLNYNWDNNAVSNRLSQTVTIF